MPYWPGRRPNVNDKHHGIVSPPRSIAALGDLMSANDLEVININRSLALGEATAKLHLDRKAILEVVAAMPLMRRRADKRRRPNRVGKRAFVLYRKLKLV